jgi:hypothetical protein
MPPGSAHYRLRDKQQRPCLPHATRSQAAVPSAKGEIIAAVPRISEFYGIVIEIAGGEVIAGSLPGRALRLVREWIDQHRDELDSNWERAMHHQKPQPIDPLR